VSVVAGSGRHDPFLGAAVEVPWGWLDATVVPGNLSNRSRPFVLWCRMQRAHVELSRPLC
jgi:hypothetical protein